MLAQGPWPPAPLGFVLCHPVSSAPSSALLCPGSGSLAVSRVPPFLICMFKMYLQSIFLLRSSLPLRLPAVSLGAGLCPCRGAQMSTPTRFPMPASSEGPCFYWGCPGFACTRGLCSLTGGRVMLSGHRPDTVSVSLCQAGPSLSNRFSLIIANTAHDPSWAPMNPLGCVLWASCWVAHALSSGTGYALFKF